jgi:hypothetical protein
MDGITLNLLSNKFDEIINYDDNMNNNNMFKKKSNEWHKGFCNIIEPIINKTNFGNIANIKISNDGDLLNNIILNISLPKC